MAGKARGGAKAKTGLRRGRSASTASSGTHHPSANVQLCGTCCMDVGDDSIGCDECEVWVHNTEMCSGLTTDMLEAIDRYSGAGIKFVCTKCRLDYTSKRGGSPTSSTESHLVELIKHLAQQVKGICNQVQELKQVIKDMSTQPKSVHPDPTPDPPTPAPAPGPAPTRTYASVAVSDPGPPPHEYRKVVREELRELQEQQKRRTSLIIRGLGAGFAAEAVRIFESVSDHLINRKVILSDVVKIPSESDLYRGKVTDDDTRKLILDKAKHLRNSTRFDTVFIRRDLTYNQRAEMRARRAAAAETSTRAADTNPRPQPSFNHSSSGPDEQQHTRAADTNPRPQPALNRSSSGPDEQQRSRTEMSTHMKPATKQIPAGGAGAAAAAAGSGSPQTPPSPQVQSEASNE